MGSVETKRCRECGEIRPLHEFHKDKKLKDGHHNVCKLCAKQHRKKRHEETKERSNELCREYYQKNKEAIKLRNRKRYRKKIEEMRQYTRDNKERFREYHKVYVSINRDKINKRRNEWRNKRKRVNPEYKMKVLLRGRLQNVLMRARANKTCSPFALLGCDMKFFVEYIASKFVDGMSWKNHGKVWHVDHIVPCNSFDLTDIEQQKMCFHYTNMQPLFAVDNMKKFINETEEIQFSLV